MDNELDEEYFEPTDITSFCDDLKNAWLLTPELRLHEALSLIFNGYDLSELTPSELIAMMSEYIHQNK